MLEHAQEFERTCISLGALSCVSMSHVMLVRASPMPMYVLCHVCEVFFELHVSVSKHEGLSIVLIGSMLD